MVKNPLTIEPSRHDPTRSVLTRTVGRRTISVVVAPEGALVGFEVIGLEKRRLGMVLALIREKFSGEAPNLEQLALIA